MFYQSSRDMLKFAAEFGLTASARQRIDRLTKPFGEEDDNGAWLLD